VLFRGNFGQAAVVSPKAEAGPLKASLKGGNNGGGVRVARNPVTYLSGLGLGATCESECWDLVKMKKRGGGFSGKT